MKLILEPTSKVVEINGVPTRIWEGNTEGGVPVEAFITRVAVPTNQPEAVREQFRQALTQVRPPSAATEAYPLRMTL